ncbi:MAG: nuclear transport factor 2 family protein [Agriterribacter sp.]
MATTEQISNYIDRTNIGDLLTKYFFAVDDKHLDLTIVKATFTIDAKIIRPNGSATVGHDNIFDGHQKSFARFKATHHVITDYIVNITDNTAILRANLTAMHLWADSTENPSLNGKHFLAGAVLVAKATKVDNNWQISELTNHNVWRTGEGMNEMANYERSKTENS